MKTCSICGEEGQVIDSRKTATGTRRRRECVNGDRWTTYEVDTAAIAYLKTRQTLEDMGYMLLELAGVEETSMQCPECGGLARAVDTEQRNYGTYRRRACEGCSYRFSTRETISEEAEPISKQPSIKHKKRSKPKMLTQTPARELFLKARQWGLNITDLTQAGRDAGIEAGAVLNLVQASKTREEALSTLGEWGLLQEVA